MNQFLLDTNILIYFLKGNQKVIELLSLLDKTPFISTISIMELYHGAVTPEDGKDIDELLNYVSIIPMDQAIAKKAGEILAQKRKRGEKKFHKEDVLIAATAIMGNCTLITANTKDFHGIGGLVYQKFLPSS